MVDGRLIVTGHKGFVGKSLVKMARSQGIDVLTVEGDLLDKDVATSLSETISGSDVLVHLAGTFFGGDSEIIKKNTLVSLVIAKIASEKPNLKVILTSTGAVYGNSGSEAISESTVLTPNTVYGMAKKWGEEAFGFYMSDPLRQLTVFRLPSVYGPGNETGVIARFIKSIDETGSLTLHGTGGQRRSFLHVEDLCEAILNNAKSSVVGTFNLSETVSYSLSEIIQILKRLALVNVINVPAVNVLESMVLDSSSYCSLSGWHPSRSVNEFIKKQFD